MGHRAGECSEKPECPLCRDLGLPAGHRFGGPSCKPPKRRRDAGGPTQRTTAGQTLAPASSGLTSRGGEANGTQAYLINPTQMSEMQDVTSKSQRPPKSLGKNTEIQKIGVAGPSYQSDDVRVPPEEAMDVGQ